MDESRDVESITPLGVARQYEAWALVGAKYEITDETDVFGAETVTVHVVFSEAIAVPDLPAPKKCRCKYPL